MKYRQLKITNYFNKNLKKKKNIKMKSTIINRNDIKKKNDVNKVRRKLYRKSISKKIINERKIKYCLYELSRVRI